MLKRIPLRHRILVVLVLVAVLLNPLTNQYVLEGLEWGLITASRELGAYATAIASAYIVGSLAWNIYQDSRIKVPPKGKVAKNKRIGRFMEE